MSAIYFYPYQIFENLRYHRDTTSSNSRFFNVFARTGRYSLWTVHINLARIAGWMMIALKEEETRVEIAYYLSRAPLEKSEALMLMHSFAEALNELHKQGELWDHCETGVEVLPDFSIKIHGTVSERNNRLNEGDVDVNRSVAPPEYMNSGIHDVRSDIFAWGIVVYELVTGECPLKGETLVELIEAGLQCNFTPVHEIKNDFPLRLSNIISKAISKEADDRFQNTKELLESLEDKL